MPDLQKPKSGMVVAASSSRIDNDFLGLFGSLDVLENVI
jgi:hypothetical protein